MKTTKTIRINDRIDIPVKDLKKWIKALRSGKYKQTTKTLQDDNGYCCLGVACKVLIPENLFEYEVHRPSQLLGNMPDRQGASPEWLQRINTEVHKYSKDYQGLTYANDFGGHSFDDIANVLEDLFIEAYHLDKGETHTQEYHRYIATKGL